MNWKLSISVLIFMAPAAWAQTPLPAIKPPASNSSQGSDPLLKGRWVMVQGDTVPSLSEIYRQCEAKRIYLDVTNSQLIHGGSESVPSICDLPSWRETSPGRFIGKLKKCQPQIEPGEDEISIEIRAKYVVTINNSLFLYCQPL